MDDKATTQFSNSKAQRQPCQGFLDSNTSEHPAVAVVSSAELVAFAMLQLFCQIATTLQYCADESSSEPYIKPSATLNADGLGGAGMHGIY